jgi:hypothetical protein
MPLSFPETGDSDAVVGQTPWSARVPLDPLLCNEISLIESQRADEGVGCGPGGPPHKLSELSGFGTTKWHWDAILRRIINPPFLAPIGNQRASRRLTG